MSRTLSEPVWAAENGSGVTLNVAPATGLPYWSCLRIVISAQVLKSTGIGFSRSLRFDGSEFDERLLARTLPKARHWPPRRSVRLSANSPNWPSTRALLPSRQSVMSVLLTDPSARPASEMGSVDQLPELALPVQTR